MKLYLYTCIRDDILRHLPTISIDNIVITDNQNYKFTAIWIAIIIIKTFQVFTY